MAENPSNREHYGDLYFSGEEDSGYSSGVYGKGLIWNIKFLIAALHTRYELLRNRTNPSVLDIGGANGSQASYFEKMGFKAVTLDISDWSRQERRTQNHVQGNALFLPFADNSFDTIYCNDLMEHFTRKGLKQFLGEAKRVLKPGGVGILVPVTALEARRKGETDQDNERKGHISLFPRGEWQEVIESSGFVVRKPRILTNLMYSVGRLYPMRKAWIPTARDGIFIVEKPSTQIAPS